MPASPFGSFDSRAPPTRHPRVLMDLINPRITPAPFLLPRARLVALSCAALSGHLATCLLCACHWCACHLAPGSTALDPHPSASSDMSGPPRADQEGGGVAAAADGGSREWRGSNCCVRGMRICNVATPLWHQRGNRPSMEARHQACLGGSAHFFAWIADVVGAARPQRCSHDVPTMFPRAYPGRPAAGRRDGRLSASVVIWRRARGRGRAWPAR